jgi:hypothetical protein
MNKNQAFFDCLAARVDDADIAGWYDRIFNNPSNGAYLDQAQDADGNKIGPATMAQDVVDYCEGRIDMPTWMQPFNK